MTAKKRKKYITKYRENPDGTVTRIRVHRAPPTTKPPRKKRVTIEQADTSSVNPVRHLVGVGQHRPNNGVDEWKPPKGKGRKATSPSTAPHTPATTSTTSQIRPYARVEPDQKHTLIRTTVSRSRNNVGMLSGTPKKGTSGDRVRAQRFAELIKEGMNEVDAYWKTISDPGFGFLRFRGAKDKDRPTDLYLRRSMAALLQRAAPEAVLAARAAAMNQLASLHTDATDAVTSTVRGKFRKAADAQVRLNAAKFILDSLMEQKQQAPINVSVHQQQAIVAGAASVLDILDSRGTD